MPRVNGGCADAFEVPRIARDDGEIVGECSGRDQRIDGGQGPSTADAVRDQGRPAGGNTTVHGQDAAGKPCFQVLPEP